MSTDQEAWASSEQPVPETVEAACVNVPPMLLKIQKMEQQIKELFELAAYTVVENENAVSDARMTLSSAGKLYQREKLAQAHRERLEAHRSSIGTPPTPSERRNRADHQHIDGLYRSALIDSTTRERLHQQVDQRLQTLNDLKNGTDVASFASVATTVLDSESGRADEGRTIKHSRNGKH
jgi:hypothetical protein